MIEYNLLCNLVLLIITLTITMAYFWIFIFPLVGGAPYAPSKQGIIDTMIKLSEIKKGEKVADLGSGDGRIVFSFAEKGANAHGYEISPILVWWSKILLVKRNLLNKAFIHRENFWRVDFSSYDVVAIYQVTYVMNKLEKKLIKELKPGARVVCNAFKFKNWQPAKKENGVSLYIKE